MSRCRWAYLVFLLYLGTGVHHVHADIDVAEYQTSRAVRSDQERKTLQEHFEVERRLEAEREAAAQASEARRRAEAEAREAARPWPERLTETQCSKCHTDQNYQRVSHALPGWWLVILRMRYFNQAELSWHDMWTISQHLTVTYPADFGIVLIEWSAPILAIIVSFLLLDLKRRFLSNRYKES